jgi:hypothetical protein
MGVDLRKFLKKIEKDVVELFDSRVGLSPEDKPALAAYNEHDKEDFIFNP